MSCLFCGAEGVTRRVIDPEPADVVAEVCEACAEERLLVDRGSPTCEFCGELGQYDLASLEGPVQEGSQVDVERDLETIERDVLCEEHLGDLQADADGD